MDKLPREWWDSLKEEEQKVICFLEGIPHQVPDNLYNIWKKYRLPENLNFEALANITKKDSLTTVEVNTVKVFIELIGLKKSFANKAHTELKKYI